MVEGVAGRAAEDASDEELGGRVHAKGVALVEGEERLESGDRGEEFVAKEEGDEHEIGGGRLGVTRRHSVTAAEFLVLLVYFDAFFRTRLLYELF